jgi:hypothetical protein
MTDSPAPVDFVKRAQEALAVAEQELLRAVKIQAVKQWELDNERHNARLNNSGQVWSAALAFRKAEEETAKAISKVCDKHINLVAHMAERKADAGT